MAKKKIKVEDIDISIVSQKENDFFSITDIARKASAAPKDTVKAYLRNGNNIEYMAAWERLYNKENFKEVVADRFRSESVSNAFTLSVKEWREKTNAIGIYSEKGRYGGTYAHKDIALQFAMWLSPVFHLYIVKEFDRLKHKEAQLLGKDWNLKREIAKANYPLLTEAVKANLIPKRLPKNQQGIVYASEADILNVAVFGYTAKEWQKSNPKLKGNIRDNASAIELLLISNLQVLDASLIKWGCDQKQRMEILEEKAKEQRAILSTTQSMKRINKK